MNFSWYFAKKIAWNGSGHHHLSHTIIRIGQVAVIIGITVAYITLSMGIGARKEIKQKLADFNGHITVKPYSSNLSYNSDSITLPKNFYPVFPLENVEHIQAIATMSGIIRTNESFDGVLFKGVDSHFDRNRFEKFLRKGSVPKMMTDSVNNHVMISQKIANSFRLDVDSSFVMVFINEKNQNKPVYRKFMVEGIYVTDIKEFDDLYVIGDIQHVQRVNRWPKNQVGSFELFIPDIERNLKTTTSQVNEIIGYNLTAESALDAFADLNEWIDMFDNNIVIILSIMMIVVSINIIMILLILILERAHSIGVLKTLGSTNWQIRKIFIYYTLFIMIPGLIIGNILGLGFLWIQEYFGVIELPPENYFISKAPVYLDWQMVFLINACSLLISFLVLLVPSYLIKRITPVKALRM